MTKKLKTIKSYVKRMSRMTERQKTALKNLWHQYGVELTDQKLDFLQLFGRDAPTIVEIGFGNGDSLLQMAETYPAFNFIGIEVHLPGVGNLLDNIQCKQISNIRIFQADAIDVLKQCIPENSLSHVLVFFPDPWPKTRHHKRRLVQTEFVNLISSKLQLNGLFHLATDWDDYAIFVKKVMLKATQFKGVNAEEISLPLMRSMTKFENRGKQLGHTITDLFFIKYQEQEQRNEEN